MSESNLQRSLIRRLEKNYLATTINVISGSKRGISDLICCVNGRYVAIEVKLDSKKYKATALQKHFLAETIKAKGIGFIAESWDDVVTNLTFNGIYPKVAIDYPNMRANWDNLAIDIKAICASKYEPTIAPYVYHNLGFTLGNALILAKLGYSDARFKDLWKVKTIVDLLDIKDR